MRSRGRIATTIGLAILGAAQRWDEAVRESVAEIKGSPRCAPRVTGRGQRRAAYVFARIAEGRARSRPALGPI